MPDYDKAAATATRLIRENGRLVDCRKLAKGTDPDKPWNGGPGQRVEFVIQDIWCMFSPVSDSILRSGLGRSVLDVQLNKKVEQLAIVGPVDTRLEYIDEIVDKTYDGRIWRVLATQVLHPKDRTLLYTYTLKR